MILVNIKVLGDTIFEVVHVFPETRSAYDKRENTKTYITSSSTVMAGLSSKEQRWAL